MPAASTANTIARRKRTAPPLTGAQAAPKEKGPNIGYVRPEITALANKWRIVADCLGGQEKIRSREDLYLPRPNASDKSPENLERYTAYQNRAVFYNVTSRTMDGLIGQVFSRDPIVELPDEMLPMIEDVDGSGVSLDQQAKLGLARSMGGSGFGLLVDYPITSGATSLADQKAGYIRPTITQYTRADIINWRYIQRGAKKEFSLIVIEVNGQASDDGFEISYEQQWRTLALDARGEYVVTTWNRDVESGEYNVVTGPIKPVDAKGKPFTRIPFHFCGVLNNDATPDEPPMYNLAVLNVAHYRNSADYEDSCWMVGQPTPFFAGLTEAWVNKVFKNKTIQLGSRAAIPLPVGGTAGLLQAAPNSMPFEAMKHKEAQMLALGAKIIEPGSGSGTLGEAQLDESSESSMLATAAKNVSGAYQSALKDAGLMQGTETDKLVYSLNTDFPASRLTPNERTQLVLEWQAGAITETEMRAGLRKAGVATLDAKEYKAELIANPPPQPEAATNNGGKGGADNNAKTGKDEQNNGGNQNKV